MVTHLGQAVSNHITLELVGGIRHGYGEEQLGWIRVLPDGSIESGPDGGNYVVPIGRHLVITDIDWQFDDHGTANVGAAVTLRLFVVGTEPNGHSETQTQVPPGFNRMMESTVMLGSTGTGGIVTNWVSGAIFGPGTRVGIDTFPFSTANRLQHAMLHGYSFSTLKLDRQKVAVTLIKTRKTGFYGCTLLGSDGSIWSNDNT